MSHPLLFICHPLLLSHSRTIFLLNEKFNWLARFCSWQNYIGRYLFSCCKKEKKPSCCLVFLKNILRTETNWTSLAFLTSSFFTFLRQALHFSILIVLELHPFSKSSEISLMAVREFQLILLRVPCTAVNCPTYWGSAALCGNKG